MALCWWKMSCYFLLVLPIVCILGAAALTQGETTTDPRPPPEDPNPQSTNSPPHIVSTEQKGYIKVEVEDSYRDIPTLVPPLEDEDPLPTPPMVHDGDTIPDAQEVEHLSQDGVRTPNQLDTELEGAKADEHLSLSCRESEGSKCQSSNSDVQDKSAGKEGESGGSSLTEEKQPLVEQEPHEAIAAGDVTSKAGSDSTSAASEDSTASDHLSDSALSGAGSESELEKDQDMNHRSDSAPQPSIDSDRDSDSKREKPATEPSSEFGESGEPSENQVQSPGVSEDAVPDSEVKPPASSEAETEAVDGNIRIDSDSKSSESGPHGSQATETSTLSPESNESEDTSQNIPSRESSSEVSDLAQAPSDNTSPPTTTDTDTTTPPSSELDSQERKEEEQKEEEEGERNKDEERKKEEEERRKEEEERKKEEEERKKEEEERKKEEEESKNEDEARKEEEEERKKEEKEVEEKPEVDYDDDDQVLTFEEFKKKREEGQGQQRAAEEMVAVGGSKKTTFNNYASSDCGAKVIETNPEAQNSMAILLENKDVYMINPCSANISFVVELCEMISLRTLEIACFEFFSSIPKSFKVSSSESWPDAEWSVLGTFEAPNERKIHSFPVPIDKVYAKFMKFEMLSFYGDEHYCPLSLLRVLGASMMDVYEESQQKVNGQPSLILPPSEGFGEDDAALLGMDEVDENDTLLGVATDAVLRVLKKPLTLLGKKMNLIHPDDESADNHVTDDHSPSLTTPTISNDLGYSPQDEKGGVDTESKGQADVDQGIESDASMQEGPTENGKVSGGQPPPLQEEPRESIMKAEVKSSGEGDISTASQISPPQDHSTITSTTTTSDPGQPGDTVGVVKEPLHLADSAGQLEDDNIDPSHSQDSVNTANGATDSKSGSGTDHTQGSVPVPSSIPSSLGPDPVRVLEPDSDTGDLPDARSQPPAENGLHATPPEPTLTSPSADKNGKLDFDDADSAKRDDSYKDELEDNSDILEPKDSPMSNQATASVIKEQTLSDANEGGPSISNDSLNVDPPQEPKGGDVNSDSGGIEGARGPLTGAGDPGKGEKDQVRDQQPTQQQTDSAHIDQPSDELKAATPGHKHSEDTPLNSSSSTELDQPDLINTDSIDVVDPDSLSTGPASHLNQHPLNASLAPQNGSESEPPQSGSNLTEDSSNSVLPRDSSLGGSSNLTEGVGNQTGGNIGTKNGNESNVVGPPPPSQNGNLTQDNDSQVPMVQNQTALNRTGNQNGHSGNGMGMAGLPAQQREKSVFLRLSNQISELQENMTLFSIFLDQISTSLKKNKNKTEETTKWLEKRISSLNGSFLELKGDIASKLEMVTELRLDVLELTKSLTAVSTGLLDLRIEVYGVMIVMALLQMSLILLTLLSCMWQCYSNTSLRRQINSLKPTPHLASSATVNHQPLTVESLGSQDSSKKTTTNGLQSVSTETLTRKRDLVNTLPPVLPRSGKSKPVRRSSSASDLVSRSSCIQAKLSRSDCYSLASAGAGAGGEGEGDGGRGEGEEEDTWLVSSSDTNLDSLMNSWQSANFAKKKRKSKPIKR